MFNSRGQEAAPFELLIAVIIMTFVIVLGMNALDILAKEKCQGELDAQMEQIKTSLETVAKGQGGKATIEFRFPGCFKENESRLNIQLLLQQTVCSSICGGNRVDCVLLRFTNPYESNTKCLNISTQTVFGDSTICDASRISSPDIGIEYEEVEWDSTEANQIFPGKYVIMKEFNQFSESPTVCVYRQKVS
jgi:hypothetical protein